MLVLIAAVCFFIGHTHGYSSGAPPFKCEDMIPSHSGIQPEMTPAPYTITANSNTYKLGEAITVTLQTTSGAAFKGFLVAAKDSGSLQTIHGQFTNSGGGQVLSCGVSNAGAVTHSSAQQLYNAQFQWQPTAGTTGSVVFLATVVESYTTFWTNIQTSVINPAAADTTPAPTNPPTQAPEVTTQKTTTTTTVTTPVTRPSPVTQPSTNAPTTTPASGSLTTDPECGVTKGCFIKCSGGACDYVVTWRDNVDNIDFELSTKLADTNNKWIAIAFSSDLKMGGDEVIGCFNVGGTTDVRRSYNNGRSNVAVSDPTNGLSNTVVTVKDGVFRCSFSKQKNVVIQKRQTGKSVHVNLNNDFNLMFGNGPAYPGSIIGMHSVNPDVTPGSVDFQSFEVIGDTAKFPLVKLHGCLMIIAWIFCTGIAIMTAKFYKPVWSKSTILKQKVWFQIHRTLMVTATISTILAFIVIFIEVGGYSEIAGTPGKEYLPAHPILGIIVTILCIVNPIMSFFRPGPTDSKRPIFNWAHWGVGMLAQILAILTIIFGVELQKSSAPKYTAWVVVGFVIYYVIMEIAQRVLDKMADRKTGGQPDAVEMKQNGNTTFTQPPEYSETDKNKKDTLLKKSLLGLHGIVTLTFTLTLILLVSMY